MSAVTTDQRHSNKLVDPDPSPSFEKTCDLLPDGVHRFHIFLQHRRLAAPCASIGRPKESAAAEDGHIPAAQSMIGRLTARHPITILTNSFFRYPLSCKGLAFFL